MPGRFFRRYGGAGHYPGTMNPPREDQSAGQETVHAEITGGPTPPIRTQAGLPADRAKLLDWGEHGSQVPEARRSGGHHLATPRGLGGSAGRRGGISTPGAYDRGEESGTHATGLCGDSRAVARQQVCHAATAVGGIPADHSGWLSLFAVLRAIPAL